MATKFKKLIQHYRTHATTKAQYKRLLATLTNVSARWPLRSEDLQRMFNVVDEQMFEGLLRQTLQQNKIQLKIVPEDPEQDVDTVGKTYWRWGSSTMYMFVNSNLLSKVFHVSEETSALAGGEVCTSRQHCFIVTFLHEMCHVFVLLYRVSTKQKRTWKQSAHGKLFSAISRGAFLQFDHQHVLLVGFRAYANVAQIKRDIRGAAQVELFEDGSWSVVTLMRINKDNMAVISVHGDEFDVPLGLLRPSRSV